MSGVGPSIFNAKIGLVCIPLWMLSWLLISQHPLLEKIGVDQVHKIY
jgi:hypothetical protein